MANEELGGVESRQNLSGSDYGERRSSEIEDEEAINESEVERQVEEFRRKMETLSKESTGVKRKMKPNISNEWLRELRLRLKSSSTTTENSMERQERQ